jgi:hypothetical protein
MSLLLEEEGEKKREGEKKKKKNREKNREREEAFCSSREPLCGAALVNNDFFRPAQAKGGKKGLRAAAAPEAIWIAAVGKALETATRSEPLFLDAAKWLFLPDMLWIFPAPDLRPYTQVSLPMHLSFPFPFPLSLTLNLTRRNLFSVRQSPTTSPTS